MPNINLIADRREEKRKMANLSRQLFLACVASAAVLVGVFIVLGSQRIIVTTDISRLENKLANLKPTLDKIADIEKETAALLPKVETLEQAKDATTRYRALLQYVSSAMPPNVHLNTLSSSGDLTATQVTLNAVAPSMAEISEAVGRLKQYPLFIPDTVSTPGFTNTAGPGDTQQRLTFEIRATMRPVKIGPPVTPSKPAPGTTIPVAPSTSTAKTPGTTSIQPTLTTPTFAAFVGGRF